MLMRVKHEGSVFLFFLFVLLKDNLPTAKVALPVLRDARLFWGVTARDNTGTPSFDGWTPGDTNPVVYKNLTDRPVLSIQASRKRFQILFLEAYSCSMNPQMLYLRAVFVICADLFVRLAIQVGILMSVMDGRFFLWRLLVRRRKRF